MSEKIEGQREREKTHSRDKHKKKMKKVIHLVVGVIFIIPDLITFQSMMKWYEMRREKKMCWKFEIK